MEVWGIFSSPMDEDNLLELWETQEQANRRLYEMKRDPTMRCYSNLNARELPINSDASETIERCF